MHGGRQALRVELGSVDVTGDKKKIHDVVTERITRAPKASFVESLKLD